MKLQLMYKGFLSWNTVLRNCVFGMGNILFRYQWINSLWSSDDILWLLEAWSSSMNFKLTVCCLFDAKPLPELGPFKANFCEVWFKIWGAFHSRHAFEIVICKMMSILFMPRFVYTLCEHWFNDNHNWLIVFNCAYGRALFHQIQVSQCW